MTHQPIEAYDLRADHALNALALPGRPARLFWKVRGAGAAIGSVAIEAASSRELLTAGAANIWRGSLCQSAAWADWPSELALGSRSVVWWRVKLTNVNGDAGEWSETATFEVALTEVADWQALWITHPAWRSFESAPPGLPRLSQRFVLDQLPTRARLYNAGLGVFETFINGNRVGDAYLEAGYADYRRRIPASAWDVAALLQVGENTIEAALGTGMSWVARVPGRYTKLVNEDVAPQYLAQLEIIDDVGGNHAIATDATWSAALGSDALTHWYGGQDVILSDDVSPAVPAAEVSTVAESAPLWWKTTAPIRVVAKLAPQEVTHFPDGRRVVDFGTNIAGQVRASLRCLQPGKRIEFWPSELLTPTGTVDQTSTGHPIFDSLTSSGPAATFAPTLTYHGFRYVEVVGLEPEESSTAVTAEVLRADLPRVGTTNTSSPFLNKLHTIIDRAVQGNMYSVFTDCPHREKLGWIEQLYICFDVLSRSYDVAAHLRQSLVLVRDAQLESGMIPSIVPEYVNFSGDEWMGDPDAFRDDPNWGGAIVFVPWRLFTTYADRDVLVENWDAMERYVAYLRSRESDGIVNHGLGDWIAIDASTPRAMVATFGYARALDTLADVADELGRRDAAVHYRAEAHRVIGAFRDAFGHDNGRLWGSGSQASFALALDLGAVQPDSVKFAWQGLLGAIRAARGQISVGENALPSLLRVLTAGNRSDIIDSLIRQPTGPGYAYQIDAGVTALTESWQGPNGPVAQQSQNHFMLAVIDDWITGTVCGLRQADDSIGWQRVVIEPTPLDTLEWAETSFDAPSGSISVRWDRDGDDLLVRVSLPAGVTGVLRVGDVGEQLAAGTHSVRRRVAESKPGTEKTLNITTRSPSPRRPGVSSTG
jgi:alpha-L-rhamnosidase